MKTPSPLQGGAAARLVLASASGARADMLRRAGLDVEVAPAAVDEEGAKASLKAEGATASELADDALAKEEPVVRR